jgi:hypothetical protein
LRSRIEEFSMQFLADHPPMEMHVGSQMSCRLIRATAMICE